jgi:hypothetical protein
MNVNPPRHSYSGAQLRIARDVVEDVVPKVKPTTKIYVKDRQQ